VRERQPRGGRRRFEIDEEDIEEGLSELHGDVPYDSDDDGEDEEYDEYGEYDDQE
jgi:hypothetical protein